MGGGGGEDRIGTGPPRARTEVICVDLGYWAFGQCSDDGGAAHRAVERREVEGLLAAHVQTRPLVEQQLHPCGQNRLE